MEYRNCYFPPCVSRHNMQFEDIITKNNMQHAVSSYL